MDFTFEINGLEQMHKATAIMIQETDKELRKALFLSAQKVDREAKDSIRGGKKSGVIYKRGNVIHRASAAGEAPASDTGRLLSSISSYAHKSGALEAFVTAGRGLVNYARHLEFGTVNMAARPFMFPAYEKSKAWIKDRVEKAVNDAALKAGKK